MSEQKEQSGLLMGWRRRALAMHRDESGAVALLCMAAALILFMLAMVLYDSTQAVNEKVHVQAGVEASVYSQATIHARTMNMTAFANVGKRFVIGLNTAYNRTLAWLRWITGAAAIITALCAIASIFLPPLAKVCETLLKITLGAICVNLKEIPDSNGLADQVVDKVFGPELRALDNYQQYFRDLTPYWGWTEASLRGYLNRTPIVLTYPTPKRKSSALASVGDTKYSLKMPVRKPANHSWNNLCDRASDKDRTILWADFLIKNAMASMAGKGKGGFSDSVEASEDFEGQSQPSMENGGSDQLGTKDDFAEKCKKQKEDDDGNPMTDDNGDPVTRDCTDDEIDEMWSEAQDAISNVDCTNISSVGVYGSVFLSGSMAMLVNSTPGWLQKILAVPAGFNDACKDQLNSNLYSNNKLTSFKKEGAPMVLMSGLGASDWQMATSYLGIAFRPNSEKRRSTDDELGRFNFVKHDYDTNLLTSATPSLGTWAMARSEMVFQPDPNDSQPPNLWQSRWAARMRPVALPGEWDNLSVSDFAMIDVLEETSEQLALMLAEVQLILDNLPGEFEQMVTHPIELDQLLTAGWTAYRTFEGMNREMMEGVSK
jgi:hypothetical protein